MSMLDFPMLRRAILVPLILLFCGGPTLADTVGTLLGAAHAAEAKGDTELALRMAQSAIVADPARPGSYVALGDIYAGEHQPQSARVYYDEALGIDPSYPAALKAVAVLDRSVPAAASAAGTSVAHP